MSTSTGAPDIAGIGHGSRRGRVMAVAVVLVLALVPFVSIPIPGLFTGPLDSPGTLVILATGLVYAGIAMSYDQLLGTTGLLSLGHALFVALGVYATTILVNAGWGLPGAMAAAIGLAAAVALVLGAIALRVDGVAFAMVTLAFAEAFWILVNADPLDVTNGEEGIALVTSNLPALLRGVANTRFVYWAALAFSATAWVVVNQVVGSRAGHVYRAVRDNPGRVELLGLYPRRFALQSFVTSGAVAGMGGAVWILVVRGASPNAASTAFTLNLVIMVVLGGLGRLWGAALGGLVFAWLELRLPALAGSGVVDGLHPIVARPLSEPAFILGSVFVLLVMFAPGGLAAMAERVRTTLGRGATPRTSS